MAIVDTDFLAGVRTLFQATFDQVFGEAPMVYQQFATVVDTEQKSTLTFNWLGAPPMMRTMKDSLIFGKSFSHNYTVNVDENGVGIIIKEQAFMNDPLGTITRHVEDLMRQAAKYYDKIAIEGLSLGFTQLCFDGLSMFNGSHAIGDGATFGNSDTDALDNTGAAYQVGWQKMNAAEDDAGEPMGIVPTVMVVHSNNRLTARQLLNATIISNTTNVLQDDVALVVTPWITTATHWFLGAGDRALAPIILAEQMAARFVANDGLDSPNAFRGNEYEYKVDNKVSQGFGDPRTAYASNGTT